MTAKKTSTPTSEHEGSGPAVPARWSDGLVTGTLGMVCFATALAYDTNIHGTFDLSKLTFLYAAAVVLVAWFAYRSVFANDLHFVRTPLDWPIVATIAALAVSTALSVDVRCSVVGAYKTFEGVFQALAYLVLFFAASRLRRGQVVAVLGMIVLAAFGAGVYGLEQRLGHDPLAWTKTIDRRAIGTFGNPVFFGMYVAVAVPLAAGLALRDRRSEPSDRHGALWWSAAAIVTGLVAAWAYPAVQVFRGADNTSSLFRALLLVASSAVVCLFVGGFFRLNPRDNGWSRGQGWLMVAMAAACNSALYASRTVGVLLALIVGALFFVAFAWLVDRASMVRHRWTWLALGICILVTNSGFNLWPETSTTARVHRLLFGTQVEATDTEDTGERFKFKPAGSLYKRLLLYKTGLNIIRAHPLFGIGPDAVERVISTYWSVDYQLAHEYLVEVEGYENRLHNEVLEVTATQGIVGLTARLWLYLAFLVMVWRGSRVVAAGERTILMGIASSWVVLTACNVFEYPTIPLSTAAWVLMGCGVAWIRTERPLDAQPLVPASRTRYLVAGAALTVVALLPWFWIVALHRPYVADSLFMKAKILEQRQPPEAHSLMERAVAANPHLHVYRESLSNVLIARINALAKEPGEATYVERDRLTRKLIANSEEQVARSPWRANGYAFLAAGQLMLADVLADQPEPTRAIDVAERRRLGTENLRKAVKINSFNNGLRVALARDCVRNSRWDEFIPLAQQTLRYWPTNERMPQLVLRAASTLVNSRDLGTAERLLLAVKDLMPPASRSKVWEGLAHTYWAAQRWADMEGAGRTLQRIAPANPEGFRFRALVALQTNRLDEAEAQARQLLELKPGDEHGSWLLRSIASAKARQPSSDGGGR